MRRVKLRIAHMAAVAQHEGRRSRRQRAYELRADAMFRCAVDLMQYRSVQQRQGQRELRRLSGVAT